MDPPVKAGPLLLQQPPAIRLGAKRWKRGWWALFPSSAHGVARLESCGEGGPGVGGAAVGGSGERRVVRLSECVRVAPEPGAAPREGLAAFRLETSRRAFLFAAEPRDADDWVARLCEAAFPGRRGAGRDGEQPQEVAANALYASPEEAREFWVAAQKTEAAERCGLQGRYLLRASGEGLLLADPRSGRTLFAWPYRLLRRYGRDKVMFSFEAGRRCESGPGNFTFETTQGNEIFRLVELAIQSQKARAEENRQSRASVESVAADGASQATDELHAALAASLSLEAKGPDPQQRPWREGVPEGEGAGHTPRDPAAPWLRPPLEQAAAAGSIYSEPVDAVRASWPGPDPLYADPMDSRVKESSPPQSPEQRLYEQVGPGAGGKGPIYDEPEGRARQPAPNPTPASAIYDEAQLLSEAWRTQGLESLAGYELPYSPGAGDYAVPAFHQKARLPRAPKPCPAPKPPRAHKSPPGPHGTSKPKVAAKGDSWKNGGGHGGNANNNNARGQPGSEPLYSQVRKPAHGARCSREEQSVDDGHLASAVYEDLGEI